jgi:hypothetical protein
MKTLALITTTTMLLLLGSCLTEEVIRYSSTPRIDEAGSVILSLRVPGNSSPLTRALLPQQENEVSTVDVLVFDSQTDEYLYAAAGYLIKKDDEAVKTDEIAEVYNFQVALQRTEANKPVDLWVVANARSVLTTYGTDDTNDSKSEIAALLLFDEAGNATQLDDQTPTPIPMWGKLDQVEVGEGGLSRSPSDVVSLTRMVAKIDVGVKADAPETAKFQLLHVYFYNRNTKGLLLPATVDGEPNIPATARPASPQDYTNPVEYTATNNQLQSTIYAFEAQKGEGFTGTGTYANEPCLVIGGSYDGGAETFYRVDFVRGSAHYNPADNEYLHLLRNHRYAVLIQSVSAPGFTDKEQALAARPANISAGVVEWDEGGMGDIVFDDQYYLSVSRDSVTFYAVGGTQTIDIATDYQSGATQGWQIDLAQIDTVTGEPYFPHWLSIEEPAPQGDIVQGGQGAPVELVMNADAVPAEGVTRREGSFWVTAGRMKKRIKVVQLDIKELKLTLEPSALTFKRNPGAPQTVTVTVSPPGLVVTVQSAGSPSASPIIWDGNSPTDYAVQNGTQLALRPQEKTDGQTSTAAYTFTIESVDGHVASQTLNITQLPTDYIWKFQTELPKFPADYNDDGGKVTKSVLSETTWQLAVDNDDATNPPNTPQTGRMISFEGVDNAMRPSTGGLYKSYELFKLSFNHGYTERTATIKVLSDDPNYPSNAPVTFPVIQAGTAPYVNLTQPASLTLNLDNAGERDFTFRTNAGWKILPLTGYNDVVGQVMYDGQERLPDYENTEHTDALAHSDFTVGLTPKDGSTSDTQTAGTIVTGRFQVQTTHHPGASPATSQEVTLTRLASNRFEFQGFQYAPTTNASGELTAAETTVTAVANTNTGWYTGYRAFDTYVPNIPNTPTAPHAYQQDQQTFTLPAYRTSMAKTSVRLWADTAKATPDSLNALHKISIVRAAPTVAPATSSFTFDAAGNTDKAVGLISQYQGNLATRTYYPGGGNTVVGEVATNDYDYDQTDKKTAKFAMSANTGWSAKTGIRVGYKGVGMTDYVKIDGLTASQASPYAPTLSKTSDYLDNISTSYSVTLTGTYPTPLDVRMKNGATILKTVTITSSSSSVTVNFTNLASLDLNAGDLLSFDVFNSTIGASSILLTQYVSANPNLIGRPSGGSEGFIYGWTTLPENYTIIPNPYDPSQVLYSAQLGLLYDINGDLIPLPTPYWNSGANWGMSVENTKINLETMRVSPILLIKADAGKSGKDYYVPVQYRNDGSLLQYVITYVRRE